jgi:hypothetical protein
MLRHFKATEDLLIIAMGTAQLCVPWPCCLLHQMGKGGEAIRKASRFHMCHLGLLLMGQLSCCPQNVPIVASMGLISLKVVLSQRGLVS